MVEEASCHLSIGPIHVLQRMRLSSTVMEMCRLKDNGVTSLTFWGHVTSSVTWPFESRRSTS